MAFPATGTKLANLINPEVLADYVESKLIPAIKFAPLAVVNRDLQGRSGDTLSIPTYNYIGDSSIVPEGEDIPIKQLSATKTDVKVKKAGVGVQLTDEAVLSAYGDPIQEAGDQILVSIANTVENEIITTLGGIDTAMTHTATGKLTSNVIVDALVKFGEDLAGEKVLFVSPQQHADLVKEESWVKVTDMGVAVLMEGVVGKIAGCQVVISERITDTNFIIKAGAIGLLLKRETEIETDRDIINKSTVITGDKHFATYLANASKAIKITLGA